MTKWAFRLPTASAILTVLYPDVFTVYDRRVCKVLGAFDQLANMKWSVELWREYRRFVDAVRTAAPSEFTCATAIVGYGDKTSVKLCSSNLLA